MLKTKWNSTVYKVGCESISKSKMTEDNMSTFTSGVSGCIEHSLSQCAMSPSQLNAQEEKQYAGLYDSAVCPKKIEYS